METPPELEVAAGDNDEIRIANREYDGEHIIAVDFGPVVGEPSLDIVDGIAIVVIERVSDEGGGLATASESSGSDQFEFAIPTDASDVTVNDGMLTITSEQS
ncbi:hypothetical protein [Natronolimnobius baerhuensis]|uniref:SHSP domain-containing protein n=1 Tax=Natronolimnobius baerhuensis TaxID=253108 RepID=A0A202E5A2_9EURY|nr:hypothetical protein [Natronolimnobius baerhuensis]OVE83417.1 hypothetical protein B2G88_13265 [Natronolimnobius baerhuensis]